MLLKDDPIGKSLAVKEGNVVKHDRERWHALPCYHSSCPDLKCGDVILKRRSQYVKRAKSFDNTHLDITRENGSVGEDPHKEKTKSTEHAHNQHLAGARPKEKYKHLKHDSRIVNSRKDSCNKKLLSLNMSFKGIC